MQKRPLKPRHKPNGLLYQCCTAVRCFALFGFCDEVAEVVGVFFVDIFLP